MVVEAEIFPAAFACLNDTDEYVKKNCATLIREIVKHTPEVRLRPQESIGMNEAMIFSSHK